MSRRLDAWFVHNMPSKTGGKEFSTWYKVGSAFESDNGVITLFLVTEPPRDKDGQVKIVIKEPQSNGPRGDAGNSGGGEFF